MVGRCCLYGCPECRSEYFKVLKDYLKDYHNDLCKDCISRVDRNPMRVLDCKEETCSRVTIDAPGILDYLCDDCEGHFEKVKDYLANVGIDYTIDTTMVRGLDYYTNTVFEVKYTGLGSQDTVFAGGRYNGLAEEIGGKSIPGIGFAMGMERLLLTLEDENIDLPVGSDIDLYITTIGEMAKKAAFKFIYQLRGNGFKTEIDYLDRSVKSQMKAADRMNATYTIILGEDELNNGKATIKNMKTGEQEEVVLERLVEVMKSKI
ncbi:MAG: histidine--tRNA ligase [Halanaerobiales bacterium]